MLRNILWIVALGALVWIGAHARNAILSPLMTAFHATGARPTGYSVSDWVVTNASSSSQIMREVARRLNVNASPLRTSDPGYQSLTESKAVRGVVTTVIVDKLSTGTTFVVIDSTSRRGFAGISQTQSLFARVLGRLGPLHSDINLAGVLPGDLSLVRQRDVMRQAVAAVGATPQSGSELSHALSVTADSALLGGTDRLQGHSVNVQIVMTYQACRDQTEILIGSPLITMPY